MQQRQFAKQLRQNMTDAEQLLWRYLRAHRLNGQKFRRQHPIGPYVVDFVHLGAKLIIEADGGQHNLSEGDAVRDKWLISQGFKVMRFWNSDILNNTDAVLTTILEALTPSPLTPLPPGERGTDDLLTGK
ncbi:MAG: endonuclease domain-containing protein [Chitinivorax sp.]